MFVFLKFFLCFLSEILFRLRHLLEKASAHFYQIGFYAMEKFSFNLRLLTCNFDVYKRLKRKVLRGKKLNSFAKINVFVHLKYCNFSK